MAFCRKRKRRKKWIISSVAPRGAIIIDDGAKKALKSGKSLLAAGIKKVSGSYTRTSDAVRWTDTSTASTTVSTAK